MRRSMTRSREVSCFSKPVDRFTDAFFGGFGFVAKLTFCLSRGEKHTMLRHPQAIQCDERLAHRDPSHGFGCKRNWVYWPTWQADTRGAAGRKPRDCAKQFEKRHILPAQNIALADPSVPKSSDVPCCNTIHMHEIQACIHVGRYAAGRGFNDHST